MTRRERGPGAGERPSAAEPLPGPAPGPAAARAALAAGILGVLAVLVVAGVTVWRSEAAPPAPAPPPALAPPAPMPPSSPLASPAPGREPGAAADAARPVARVGAHTITAGDLARYAAFRQLTFGLGGSRRPLDELCDRALLVLAAGERGLTLSERELAVEVSRRKLIAGAMAASGMGEPSGFGARAGVPGFGGVPGRAGGLAGHGIGAPGAPGFGPPGAPGFGPPGAGLPGVPARFGGPGAGLGDPDPTRGGFRTPGEEADQVLTTAGLKAEDFAREVKDEALATKARQALVYDRIEIGRRELLAAAADQPRPPGGGGAGPAPKAPDEAALAAARQRLRRERGAGALAALMTALRRQWRVEVLAPEAAP
ncbi:MAG TPA: hypothetical protein VGQ83_33540 [Polyangia bacterium]